MKSVQVLIDDAVKMCGSEAELARRLGVDFQNVNAWHKGRRVMSPETVTAICDVLGLPGEETRQWVALALIENPKNKDKSEMLKRALFACWLAGVTSLCAFQTDARATTNTSSPGIYRGMSVIDTIYIVASWTRRQARRAMRWWHAVRCWLTKARSADGGRQRMAPADGMDDMQRPLATVA